VAAFLGVIGFGANWWILLVLFFCTASVWRQGRLSRPWKVLYVMALLAAFLAANRVTALKIAGIASGKIHTDARGAAEALILRSKPGQALVLDGDAARYVFGYKLPAGSIDFSTTESFSGHYIDIKPWKRGDIFLLSPASLDEVLRHFTFLDEPPPETWAPLDRLGIKLHTFTEPRRVFIIPVEKCKGVRPEFVLPGSPPSTEIFEPRP
jgi:hypothetical protein